MGKFLMVSLAVLALALTGCATAKFTLASTAVSGNPEKGFDSGLTSAGRISADYTGEKSFPFTWTGVPTGTKALAVVFDDPDARLVMKSYGVSGDSWIHWVATDIDPSLGGLAADASATMTTLALGVTSSGHASYGGPAPPSDVPADAPKPIIHVYRLKVYALSAPTGLKTGFTLADLTKAMEGKTLGTAELDMSYSN